MKPVVRRVARLLLVAIVLAAIFKSVLGGLFFALLILLAYQALERRRVRR